MHKQGEDPQLPEVPETFLRTAQSIHDFQRVMYKVKEGANSDANIEITRDDCRAILWAIQLLRTGGDTEHG